MCGDNMLKIDVKKTLKNGGENGMIEESAITISHSARLVSFLFFLFACRNKLQHFSYIITLFFVVIILNKLQSLDNTSAIWPNCNLFRSQGVFTCSTLDVFIRHDCNASTPIKFNYLTLFCSLVFEHHFLAFYFSWAAWFPQLQIKFHNLSSFQS